MRTSSDGTAAKYADFKLVWKLVYSAVSGRTSIRHYEADAPIPGTKFFMRVKEDPSGSRGYITSN